MDYYIRKLGSTPLSFTQFTKHRYTDRLLKAIAASVLEYEINGTTVYSITLDSDSANIAAFLNLETNFPVILFYLIDSTCIQSYDTSSC